jgi:uncharacterized membrane protein
MDDGAKVSRLAGKCVGNLSLMVVWVAMFLYTIRMGYLVLTRHGNYASNAYDLGIYDQALWLISRGLPPIVTVRGLHILGDHFSPVLWVIAPLYRLGMDVRGLLILQTVLIASGAIPTYCIARRLQISGWAAAALSMMYLMHPALQRMNLFDFHPVALCTPLLLWCLYCIEFKNIKCAVLLSSFSICCKQDAGAAVLVAGLYCFLYINKLYGWLLATVGVIITALALYTMQYFGNPRDQPYLQLYEHLLVSSQEVPLPLRPLLNCLRHAFSPDAFHYCILLWLPLGLLPLCNVKLTLVSLPLYLMNILSIRPHMRSIDFHYNALILPFLLYSCCLSIAKTDAQMGKKLLIGSFVSAIITSIYLSPAFDPWYTSRYSSKPNCADLLRSIPSSASVSASSSIVPHLSSRRYIYVFPNPFQKVAWGATRQALREQYGVRTITLSRCEFHARSRSHPVDYVVVDISDSPFPVGQTQFEQYARYMLSNPSYGIVARSGTVVVFRYAASYELGMKMLNITISRGERHIEHVEQQAWQMLRR